MKSKKFFKFEYILSFLIYGTAGCFTRFISWPSSLLVLSRGIIAILVILIYQWIKNKSLDFQSMKENILWIVLASISLAGNWLCLFGAYTHTTVAKAILCNSLAPVILVLVAPFIFKEKRSLLKYCCVFVALIGMVFISGVIDTDSINKHDIIGLVLGVCAAIFYVGMMIFNKKIKNISAADKTIPQILLATIIMSPFAFISTDFATLAVDLKTIVFVIIFGVVHTGIAYLLYLGSISELDAQTVAIYSYIEPVLSVLLSFFVLKEELTVFGWIGGVLIIGSTIVSELWPIKVGSK